VPVTTPSTPKKSDDDDHDDHDDDDDDDDDDDHDHDDHDGGDDELIMFTMMMMTSVCSGRYGNGHARQRDCAGDHPLHPKEER
jgi:hypothetical protein